MSEQKWPDKNVSDFAIQAHFWVFLTYLTFWLFFGTILKPIILFTELEGADEKKKFFFLKKSFVTSFETEVQVQARVG